jgi:hypothetical protein
MMCVAIVMVIKLVFVTTVSSVQKKNEKAFKVVSPNATNGIVGSAAPGMMVRLQV